MGSSDYSDDKITLQEQTENITKKEGKITAKKNKDTHFSRSILENVIGSGENAKNNISFTIIVSSFICIGVFTLFVLIDYWWLHCSDNKTISEEIKEVWTMVTPLLTLTLGYVFGKGK